MKRKTNMLTELQASNVTNGFDPGHDLDFEFSRSNETLTFDHTHGLTKDFQGQTSK